MAPNTHGPVNFSFMHTLNSILWALLEVFYQFYIVLHVGHVNLWLTNLLFFCQVIRHFDGCKADLVVCDGAPDG